MTVTVDLTACVAMAAELLAPGRRTVLGITGAPGVGKSTVVQAILDGLGPSAALLPMDGFHLAQRELERLGRASRKGAPDTFDVGGYVAALRRARAGEDVYVPEFRREIEEPVAGAILIPADVPLVVTEGNYLLTPVGGWQAVRPLLDVSWFLTVDDAVRRERLVARHVRFGRSQAEAEAWVAATDDPNADLVARGADLADRVLMRAVED